MENTTIITFYNGLDTIGGVIMELRYNAYRVFFEAGLAYDPAAERMIRLRQNSIADRLWLDQLPKIDGIYRREDICRFPDLKPAETSEYRDQAFFISHLHLDHMAMMGMISPEVKVYLARPAQVLEKALEDVGLGVESIRDMHYNDLEEETRIGDIYVRAFLLNDDSYQDYSFYIETPDLKLHFTGDVFVYGKYGHNIISEAAFLKNSRIDVMVCEGTRFSAGNTRINIEPSFEPKEKMISKDHLDERITRKIQCHSGLVIFNYYEREMSDVMDFERYALNTGRTIVYEPESAHLINEFFNRPVHILIPDTYHSKPEYMDQIINSNILVSKEEIFTNPDKYLLQNTYPNSLELLSYSGCDTLYLHHSGTPLGDFDPQYDNLRKIISLAGIAYYRTYEDEDGYFSPHAEDYQILSYIDMANPKLVIPCHTKNRDTMITSLRRPCFRAVKNISYVYDRENNTMKEFHE